MVGAQFVMARPGGHRDSAYLLEIIAQQQITILHFVPSMLQILLSTPKLEQCCSLKLVICSGEVLSVELQEQFFAHLDTELHNLYGPTEAAIDVTFWACRRDGHQLTVPIGRPIANTQIYLLDEHGDQVPIGLPGELHIGGIGLARGYFRQPELTAERFIPHPFSQNRGERLYKTGDLARYRADGAIEFLGRLDHQVKVHGVRIELGEIETLLRQHPAILECAMLLREDVPGDKRLVAYMTMEKGENLTSMALREALRGRLPANMISFVLCVLRGYASDPQWKAGSPGAA